MKHVLVISAGVLAAVGVFGAQPVKADAPTSNTSLTGGVTALVNTVLQNAPAPPGWQPRHACVIVDQADRGWCFTFPFPT
jgi:hypothetical protein